MLKSILDLHFNTSWHRNLWSSMCFSWLYFHISLSYYLFVSVVNLMTTITIQNSSSEGGRLQSQPVLLK